MNDKTITLIKKIAALLLLVCFVLPLSRCTSKSEVQRQSDVTDSYTYAYVIAQEALQSNNFKTLSAVFVVFFVPAVCLSMKERPQAVICFFSSFAAAYVLYGWVFLFATSPEIGGILAILCWMILFGISCTTLCKIRRQSG